MTERISFNKTRHYTLSFNFVCMIPFTMFSVLVFLPGNRLANGTRCLFWTKRFARPIDHLSVVSTNHVSTCVWFEASYLYSNHRPNNCFPFLVTACLPFRFKAVFACCVTLLLTDVDGEPPCLSGNNL